MLFGAFVFLRRAYKKMKKIKPQTRLHTLLRARGARVYFIQFCRRREISFFGGKSKLLSLISFHFSTSGSLTPFNETNDCLLQRSPQKNARRVEECEYIKLYNLKKKLEKREIRPRNVRGLRHPPSPPLEII